MRLNETPSSERLHIGFFGRRNAGKSSLVNAVAGQALCVVSPQAGTTTDPVLKAMELLPLGPVVLMDTPGADDEGELGELRVQKTREALSRTDLAVLVVDAEEGLRAQDEALLREFAMRGIPCLTVWNKCDLSASLPAPDGALSVSARTGLGVRELKERLGRLMPVRQTPPLAADLTGAGGLAVLVCPIDESAPRGRLILPQQMVLRDLLDAGAQALVTRETELPAALRRLAAPPDIVITDSQAFASVSRDTPQEIPLTSFSILMARYKGFLSAAVSGAAALSRLRPDDTVLLCEGCTHHRQCNDIGTVKLPRWLRAHAGAQLRIETCSGHDFPQDLSRYAAVVHCGGCMITEREVRQRLRAAQAQGVPFTNYGIAIALATGTLERSLRPFPALHALLAEAGE